MANRAQFTINGTPAIDSNGDRGYDATPSEQLAITLEANPALDVLTVTYELYDPAKPFGETPVNSLFTSDQNFVETGTKAITTSDRNATFHIVINPATEISSYVLRATVVTATGAEVFERMIVIRKNGLRMTVPSESTQYGARGWSDALNELTKAVADGLAGVTLVSSTTTGTAAAFPASQRRIFHSDGSTAGGSWGVLSKADLDAAVATGAVDIGKITPSSVNGQKLATIGGATAWVSDFASLEETAGLFMAFDFENIPMFESDAGVEADPNYWDAFLYLSPGPISGGEYPLEVTFSGESYMTTAVYNLQSPGPRVFEATLRAGTCNWAVLATSGGALDKAWFNLATGVTGTIQAGGSGAASHISSVGGGKYRCRFLLPDFGSNVRIYPAIADASTGSPSSGGAAGIYVSGTPNQMLVSQPKVERVDCLTARKIIAEQRDVYSRPLAWNATDADYPNNRGGVSFDGYISAGAPRHLELFGPDGNASDLPRLLSRADRKWSLYAVATRHSDASSDPYRIFSCYGNDGPGGLGLMWCGFDGAFWGMHRQEVYGLTSVVSSECNAAPIGTKAVNIAHYENGVLTVFVPGHSFYNIQQFESVWPQGYTQSFIGPVPPPPYPGAGVFADVTLHGLYLAMDSDGYGGTQDALIRQMILERHGV